MEELSRPDAELPPRLSLIVSPYVGPASEHWIALYNWGQRTAFHARIQARSSGEYRLDFLPIAQVRGGDRLDISDKARISRQFRGVWYTEPRPIQRIGEVFSGPGRMFEDVKTVLEICYLDGGVSLGSRIELAARQEYDGVALRISGQEFLALDREFAEPARRPQV